MRLYDVALSPAAAPANPLSLPNIRAMGFGYLWPEATGADVVVAVIDSGCDPNHPDLKASIIGGRSFVPGRPQDDIRDENGHGTHVAGIIAANGRVKGGAYNAKLLILKVFDASGQCDLGRVVQAINYAVAWRGPNGDRVAVINMSLGGPEYDQALDAAVSGAVGHGVLVVCAAGNSGDGRADTVELDYPAACSASLSVGAVDLDLKACYFTNTNDEVDVVAPGANIISTYPGGGYVAMSGTSMAAPHVSAFAACLIEKFARRNGRRPTTSELRSIIRLMTIDAGELGLDRATGAGFVSALPGAALLKAG